MVAPRARSRVSDETAQRVLLRRWQIDALKKFRSQSTADFLAVASPGAGKTTFALVAARVVLSGRRARLVVVVPTRHLRRQWSEAASRFGLALMPEWDARSALPADVHGVCTTYQQVASNPVAFRELAKGGMVVLDEVHHAGSEKAWGEAMLAAFDTAERRLSLSGTPFRSDTAEIPFVSYHLDEARPDYEYGYGEALTDGVVRPVFFPRFDGHMEWSAPDGSVLEATFDTPLSRSLANQRLRTALSPHGDWLHGVLRQANARLEAVRHDDPVAGGLVLTIDQDHAREVARLLRDMGTVAHVATSDDPEASLRIARFASGSAPWLVAVRMVSEGVDIPRLRVGVWATVTTSELFFRQAVGRIARVTEHRDQRAWMFLPDDFRLRMHANRIAESRRHELRRRQGDDDDEFASAELDESADHVDSDPEQLSLFQALSSTLLEDGAVSDETPHLGVVADYDSWVARSEGPSAVEFDLGGLPPPTVAGTPGAHQRGAHSVNPAGPGFDSMARRSELRNLNSVVAGEIARQLGMTHAQVNRELNRLAGVSAVGEATVAQLERRAECGRDWLRKQMRR